MIGEIQYVVNPELLMRGVPFAAVLAGALFVGWMVGYIRGHKKGLLDRRYRQWPR